MLFETNDDTVLQIKRLLLVNVTNVMATPALMIAEYKARILWQCSSLLSICVYVVAIIWSCSLMFCCCRSGKQIKRIIIMGTIIVSLTLLQIIQADSGNAMYDAIFSSTFDALGASPLIAEEFHHQVHVVINLINLLAAMTPVFILVAVCSTFSIDDRDGQPDIHFIVKRINYLKQGVALGSIVLLFGIIHMVAWMQWPKALLGESAFTNPYMNFVHANSQYWGLTFTMLLLSLYIAATLALQTRVEDAVESLSDSASKQKWLNNNQFMVTFQKHALQLGMMLMPTLAGSFDSIFELV
jgi:hypothetical protein